MEKDFIDRAYSTSGNEGMRDLYNEWAGQYDQDLKDRGYATPERVADALKRALPDKEAPILDFGCGTGLSGEALSTAGFTRIYGTDLSEEMLAQARKKGVYNKLWTTDPDADLPVRPGDYAAITAVGVISVGGAPASVFDDLVRTLAPGGLLVFSLNDQSMALPDYAGRIQQSVSCGKVKVLTEEYGPHVTAHGENSGATVFVLERLDELRR